MIGNDQIFTFLCPHCGEEQEAEAAWIGLDGECYACGGVLVIPQYDTQPKKIEVATGESKRKAVRLPIYRPGFKDTCLDLITGGRYISARNSEEDRAREHVHQLYRDAQVHVDAMEVHRKKLENEKADLWNRMKQDAVNRALESVRVETFLSLDGVGKSTIRKMQNVGLDTALDVLRRPNILGEIPRMQSGAIEAVLDECQQHKLDAEKLFYPVFTDQSDDSNEMRLLCLYLDVDETDRRLEPVRKRLSHVRGIKESFRPFTFLDRIRGKAKLKLSGSDLETYMEAVEICRSIIDEAIPREIKGTLSQNQYIRALGLLEVIHPRPLDATLHRGRGTHRGNPSLPSLVGFTAREKAVHRHVAARSDDTVNDLYRGGESMYRVGGARALAILNHPRDQQLVEDIQLVPLVETRMRDIVLRNYQRFGAKFMLSQKRVVLGDEMGLGKTIQALALMAHLQDAALAEGTVFRAIVVCPASVRMNWKREIQRFTGFHVISLQGRVSPYSMGDWLQGGGVAVTSYESLKWLPLDEVPFQVCVVDEAQYIKNPEAKRSRTCREVLRRATYAIAMTGTPIENNLEEFLNIFEATDEGTGREIRALLVDSDDPARFAAMVQSIYLRRNKQDVLLELPPLNLVHEDIELTQMELERHREDIESDDVHFMTLRQNLNSVHACGGSKLRRVLSLLEEYRENRRNVIVFTFFLDPIEWFQNQVPDAYVLHGRTNPSMRQSVIDEFSRPLRAGEMGRVMLAQIKSGGIGLNIQAASAVILLEPQFNPAVEVQAISRVHRMGQRHSVDVHRMICKATVEEILLERLYQKQEIMDLYAGDSYLKNLTPDAVDRATQILPDDERDLRTVASQRIAATLQHMAG